MDKWAEFQSPSAADTKAYYDETYGRALPVAEELSKNLDMIKTAEGRSKIYSAINNVDRAKLSMLRQSAEGLKERQKVNQRLMLEENTILYGMTLISLVIIHLLQVFIMMYLH